MFQIRLPRRRPHGILRVLPHDLDHDGAVHGCAVLGV